jgi:dTDP-4-dehydrorhamnose reductase
VIRTSSFFGPWDQHNFVTQALDAVANGRPFAAAGDMTVSPTYVPDLVNVCLDLLIDKECGIWHLTNGEAMSWAELARRACVAAGLDPAGLLEEKPAAELGMTAARPANSAMGTERGQLLPSFENALARYLEEREVAEVARQTQQDAAHYAS